MSAKALLSASVSAPPPVYVEDVFSTYLYTGNGSTQTITNGIDLDGEGGLVWIKQRSTESPVGNHYLYDTTRGAQNTLSSNTTDASYTRSGSVTSFNSSGFSVGNDGIINGSGRNLASWTFRKAEKFFDVVTYTGTGSARTIAHNLGSVPGCIIVKCTNSTDSWFVYHVGTGAFNALVLNSTDAAFGNNNYWSNTSPTSSVFSVGSDPRCNGSGQTYVAYLFAHDAGGFGDAGTDSVVKCGSFSGTGFVNLGWEPQFILFKRTDSTSNWFMIDNMRGFSQTSGRALYSNLTNAEADALGSFFPPSATGFTNNAYSGSWIYIAIRRGPMKTPESGTEVFSAVAYSGDNSGARYVSDYGFPLDLLWYKRRNGTDFSSFSTRLTGGGAKQLITSSTNAEANISDIQFDRMLGFFTTSTNQNAINETGATVASGGFRRAPGFFDVVAYTGTETTLTVNHNLGVKPELIIVKNRSGSGNNWAVLCEYCTNGSIGASGRYLFLNTTNAQNDNSGNIFPSAPTSTTFTVSNAGIVNFGTMIAYLFATCPGVSKVGSYTGTGTTLNVDCGFTAGARFVLIKRTDSTGDWYVWDTARGIISGNDPYLLLNSTAAEVTNTDYIDPLSSGFQISSTAPAAINASGGTYIFLSIA